MLSTLAKSTHHIFHIKIRINFAQNVRIVCTILQLCLAAIMFVFDEELLPVSFIPVCRRVLSENGLGAGS